MTVILAILFPLAIQYQRGGWWRILAPLTLLAAVVDVIANYTELALLTWDFPQQHELTFSTRCHRLIHQDNWAGKIGRITQAFCNFFYAGHIE